VGQAALVCIESRCARGTFAESTEQVPRFARSGQRLKETVVSAMVDCGRAAAEVTRAHRVSWCLVQTALTATATAAVVLPDVLEDEATGGLERSELEAPGARRAQTVASADARPPGPCARCASRVQVVRDAERGPTPGWRSGHQRHLATIFGDVQVIRLAYRARGEQNLYPGDAVLNLRPERHSHGLRRLAAVEAARGSVLGRGESPSTGSAAGRSGSR
jgi:hypothetical protein